MRTKPKKTHQVHMASMLRQAGPGGLEKSETAQAKARIWLSLSY
jgi:hypothetical protein